MPHDFLIYPEESEGPVTDQEKALLHTDIRLLLQSARAMQTFPAGRFRDRGCHRMVHDRQRRGRAGYMAALSGMGRAYKGRLDQVDVRVRAQLLMLFEDPTKPPWERPFLSWEELDSRL